MSNKTKNKNKKVDVYNQYRLILGKPELTNKEIDELRKYLGLLSQAICEHVWGKKFY